jgi:hypothetical protein
MELEDEPPRPAKPGFKWEHHKVSIDVAGGGYTRGDDEALMNKFYKRNGRRQAFQEILGMFQCTNKQIIQMRFRWIVRESHSIIMLGVVSDAMVQTSHLAI